MNLPLLAAAATGVQVGASIVASRFAVAEVPPLTLAMLRYGIGFLCLLPFAIEAIRSVQRASAGFPASKSIARDIAAMAALGIGQFGVLIALLNYGLKTVPAGRAALIFSLFPLLTLLLGAATGRERVTPRLLAGVLLSIAGVAVSLAPKLDAGGASHWWGELAVLASAATGALCSVLYRPYLQRYPTVPVSALAMLASVLVLAVLALGEDWPHRVVGFSASAWYAVVFIGVFSGIGYFWWLYALKHETPTRVTIFQALSPVTAALLGALFLHESPGIHAAAAIVLITLGLWLGTRPQGPRR